MITELKVLIAVLLTLIMVALTFAVRADEPLWKGLIGEAVGEGEQGMYAVACCVRNRINSGLDNGLVALKRKDLDAFVGRQGIAAANMAKQIVQKVFVEGAVDITNGATHYENIKQYGLPKWARNMRVCARIGNHTFMKAK